MFITFVFTNGLRLNSSVNALFKPQDDDDGRCGRGGNQFRFREKDTGHVEKMDGLGGEFSEWGQFKVRTIGEYFNRECVLFDSE